MFLVDASKEMFIKGEDGEPSNFDMTMQVCTDTFPESLACEQNYVQGQFYNTCLYLSFPCSVCAVCTPVKS